MRVNNYLLGVDTVTHTYDKCALKTKNICAPAGHRLSMASAALAAFGEMLCGPIRDPDRGVEVDDCFGLEVSHVALFGSAESKRLLTRDFSRLNAWL